MALLREIMKKIFSQYCIQRAALWAMLSLVLSTFIFIPQSLASGDHSHHKAKPPRATVQTPTLTVYKSATCSCCKKWIGHLEENKIVVEAKSMPNMPAIKDTYAINKQYRSCHTGVSRDGYIFEGHVPAKYIKQFLKEKPANAIGLSVPGMPVGSPGMEYKDKFMPYQVLQLNQDGGSQVYKNVTRALQQ